MTFQKGRTSWNKGKKTPEETRKKISQSKKGKPSSNKGKKRSVESRKKQSEARKGFKTSEETKKKIADSVRGEKNHRWKGGSENARHHSRLRKARKLANGGSHTLGEWENLKAQYNWTCQMCLRSEPKIKLTKDHIIPLIKGGSDNIENIQPFCKRCNSLKGTKLTLK